MQKYTGKHVFFQFLHSKLFQSKFIKKKDWAFIRKAIIFCKNNPGIIMGKLKIGDFYFFPCSLKIENKPIGQEKYRQHRVFHKQIR